VSRYPYAASGVLLFALTVVLAIHEARQGVLRPLPWHLLNFAALAVVVGTMPPPDERGRTSVRGWRRVFFAVSFVVSIVWLWSIESA
jgi:hypothetical protein